MRRRRGANQTQIMTVTVVPVQQRTAFGMSIPVIAVMTMAVSFSAASACPVPVRKYQADTILVQKQVTSKKYKIKLYPDANNEVLFFSARGNDEKLYQLYLFDMDGKLVKQANIKNKQITVLDHIEEGNYLFEVFSDDERIENGQVIIR
jgi:hypothetical protein